MKKLVAVAFCAFVAVTVFFPALAGKVWATGYYEEPECYTMVGYYGVGVCHGNWGLRTPYILKGRCEDLP